MDKERLIEYLLAELNAVVITEPCEICKEETQELCKIVHPEWFTKKRKDIKCGYELKVHDFVNKNTESKKCLEIYINDYDFAVCWRHLSLLKEVL